MRLPRLSLYVSGSYWTLMPRDFLAIGALVLIVLALLVAKYLADL